MNRLQRYFTLRTLRRHAIPFSSWHRIIQQLPLIRCRSIKEQAHLRLLTTLFLHKKQFTGAHDFAVTQEMKIVIAAQACLEVLYIGLDLFDGWIEIIVYPGPFLVKHNNTDENGIVHPQAQGLSGESWSNGPLILSWEDVARDSFHTHPGHHVVIHEFAHKLDRLSGRVNGMPPLHPDMPLHDWTEVLTQAWNKLLSNIERHHHSYLNPYAATNPGEFFAVLCEYFFTAPHSLQQHCPEVYQQLAKYFRQQPPHI